ncbi:MAG: hypothetical protein IPP35_04695 [Elusimicrobia bacterium]|nr:hypothetical protein [Elusimicrobiota bacterium]
MKQRPAFFRITSLALLPVFLGTNVLFAHAPESNLWTERRRAAVDRQQKDSSPVLASLVAGPGPLTDLGRLPKVEGTVPSPFVPKTQRLLPEGLTAAQVRLLNALPLSAGTLRRITLPPGGKAEGLVVYIQDVHGNLGAQKNMAQAVAALGARDDVDFFALEGTHRTLDLERFRAFPGRGSVRLVADFLLRENKISGPIHAAFSGPEKMPAFIGVEDPVLYQSNVDAFRKSAPRLAEARAAVSTAQSELKQKKAAVYNTELMNLDRSVEAYRQGGKFGVYLKFLAQAAPDKVGPEVKGFMRVLDMESRLDFSQVETERTRLLEKLAAALTPDQLRLLVASSVDFRAGRITSSDFYGHLSRLCSQSSVSLSAFPAMDGYIRYVLAAEAISAEDLFDGVARLEKDAYDRTEKPLKSVC